MEEGRQRIECCKEMKTERGEGTKGGQMLGSSQGP